MKTDETKEPAEAPADLAAEVRVLHSELTLLREHKMFRVYQSVPRAMLFKFGTGMAVGLGTVIGATFLLSILVWFLSQFEFVPIIGEWASEIAQEIEGTLSGGE